MTKQPETFSSYLRNSKKAFTQQKLHEGVKEVESQLLEEKFEEVAHILHRGSVFLRSIDHDGELSEFVERAIVRSEVKGNRCSEHESHDRSNSCGLPIHRLVPAVSCRDTDSRLYVVISNDLTLSVGESNFSSTRECILAKITSFDKFSSEDQIGICRQIQQFVEFLGNPETASRFFIHEWPSAVDQ